MVLEASSLAGSSLVESLRYVHDWISASSLGSADCGFVDFPEGLGGCDVFGSEISPRRHDPHHITSVP
jgi:hypothetical protein